MSGAAPLLLATRSAGKLRELRSIFRSAGLEAIDLLEAGVPETAEEDVIEAYDSFEANALAKAAYFHRATGLVTIADDSGLEVVALGGAPGVRSKRWSGRSDLDGAALDAANNALLMQRLHGAGDRRARYVCVAALVGEGMGPLVARGEVEGWLLEEPRGSGGFGYDPYFVPAEASASTFAELELGAKSGLSHRGRAFAGLIRAIAEVAGRD